jgi:hypothetical protein
VVAEVTVESQILSLKLRGIGIGVLQSANIGIDRGFRGFDVNAPSFQELALKFLPERLHLRLNFLETCFDLIFKRRNRIRDDAE